MFLKLVLLIHVAFTRFARPGLEDDAILAVVDPEDAPPLLAERTFGAIPALHTLKFLNYLNYRGCTIPTDATNSGLGRET